MQQSQEGKLTRRQQTTSSGCAVSRLQRASTSKEYLRRGVITGGATCRTSGARKACLYDLPNWWGPPAVKAWDCTSCSCSRQQQGVGLQRWQQGDLARHQTAAGVPERWQLRRQRLMPACCRRISEAASWRCMNRASEQHVNPRSASTNSSSIGSRLLMATPVPVPCRGNHHLNTTPGELAQQRQPLLLQAL